MTLSATTSGRLQEHGLLPDDSVLTAEGKPRHSLVVRVTHWVSAFAFFALLFSGAGILVAHPRFYWGEVGNVMTAPAFTLPIPSSRSKVQTRYHFVLRDHNGKFRSIHIEAAWAFVLTGLIYSSTSFWTGHFKGDLLPKREHLNWRPLWDMVLKSFRRPPPDSAESESYNGAQRIAYLVVIFVLTPLVIWTGLGMSPAVDATFPAIVNSLGGRQTARTLHLFVSGSLVLFLFVHIAMVILAGFRSRMRTMTTGGVLLPVKRP